MYVCMYACVCVYIYIDISIYALRSGVCKIAMYNRTKYTQIVVLCYAPKPPPPDLQPPPGLQAADADARTAARASRSSPKL
jgi:hypothetical protein